MKEANAGSTRRGRRLPAAVGLGFVAAVGCAGSAVGQPVHAATLATPAAVTAPSVAAQLAGLKEVTYWPADNMGPSMWINWNPGEMATDFGRAAALGANTVRLIIPPNAWGWPVPPVMLQHLSDAITMASHAGLKVQLTLFDHWADYSDQADTKTWITQVLTPYANDPRIAFVELQNEVDVTNLSQIAWVTASLPALKSVVGSIPVTVSLPGGATPATLTTLKTELGTAAPDFYDVHYYGAAQLAASTLAADEAIAAPLPLFVGETGASSVMQNAVPSDTQLQAQYLATVEQACINLGLPDAAVWTLYDFTSAFNTGPNQAQNNSYGLLATDGTVKPAGSEMRAIFATGTVPQTLNGSFTTGTQGWQAWATPASTLAWNPTVGHSALGAASLTGTVANPAGNPSLVTTPVTQPTAAGQVFRLSAWAAGVASTGTVKVTISWYDANRKWLGNTSSPALAHGTTPFTQLVAQGAAPTGAAYVQLYLSSIANPGTAYFDDVSFTQVGG